MLKSIIKGTDIEMKFEEQLKLLEEVIPYSESGDELFLNCVDRYRKGIEDGSIRNFCPIDAMRFILSLAVAYEGIDVEKVKISDYPTGVSIEVAEEKIRNNPKIKNTAENVYNLLRPNIEKYKLSFRIDEKNLNEA